MLRVALLALILITTVFADEIDDLSKRADDAESRGDIDTAKATWNLLIQRHGQNGEADQFYHYRIARIHAKEEQWADALKSFRNVFKGNWKAHFSSTAIPILYCAETQVHLSQWDDALRNVEQGLAAQPTPRVAAMLRRVEAVAHYLKGNGDLANTAWEKARQLEEGWKESPFDPVLLPFNKEIAANPKNVEPWRARIQFFEQRFHTMREAEHKAVALSTSLLDGGPKKVEEVRGGSTRLLSTQGGTFGSLSFLDDAINDASQWVRVAPKDIDARLTRARLRQMRLGLTLGRNSLGKQVKDDLDTAVRLDTRHLGARLARAEWTIHQIGPEQGNKTFEADYKSANADLSTVLLQRNIAKAHLLRCRLERARTLPDAYTLLYSAVAGAESLTHKEEETEHALSDKEKLELLVIAGRACTQRGLTSRALDLYQLGIQIIDTSSEDWGLFAPRMELPLRMLVLLVELGRYEEAHLLLDRYEILAMTTTNESGAGMVELMRAATLEGLGKTDEARELIRQYKETQGKIPPEVSGTTLDPDLPTSTPFARVRRPADRLPVLPAESAEEWKKRGNAALSEKNVPLALGHYHNALLIDPNYADAMNNRALCYVEEGKTDLALHQYAAALKADPEHYQTHFNRAKTWLSLGERAKALEDLDNAERFAPAAKKTAILDRRASYLQEADRFEDSLVPISSALAIEQNEERWQLLIYANIALLRWTETDRIGRDASAFAPDSRYLKAWRALASALGATDDAASKTAMEDLLLVIDGKNEEDSRWLGNVLRLLGKRYRGLPDTADKELALTRLRTIQARLKAL